METERIVVIGAGGMARCVLDLVDVINRHRERQVEVLGVVADPAPTGEALDLLEARGVSYLGGSRDDRLFQKTLPQDVGFVIGIGSPRVRSDIDQWLRVAYGRQAVTLVHPNVHMGFDVQLGPGCVICSHVSMENHIRLGRQVHVNQNSTIGHDAVLDHCVTVSPMVSISGNVHLRPMVFVGTGAAIREKVTVGEFALIGMGATLVSDAPPARIMLGTPARDAGVNDESRRGTYSSLSELTT